MKKLFRKRLLAYLIDFMVFAYCYELLREHVSAFIFTTNEWGYFIVFIPFIIRDLFLRNGSIGKKITGLVVVDDNWSTPSAFSVIKRTAVTTSLGHLLLCRLRLLNGNWEMAFFAELEWEYNRLKVRVVEKKVYKAIKEKVPVDGTMSIATMDQLYDQYLYGSTGDGSVC